MLASHICTNVLMGTNTLLYQLECIFQCLYNLTMYMGMLTLSKYVVHEVIFIYYPMTEDSSSEVPSASNSASVFERRSPPYVLVNPVKILHIHI